MLTRQEYSSLRQGLVGAWCPSLGATGYTLLDRSGRGNHGTLTNMGGQDNWRASRQGLAVTLDGTDDFISLGDATKFVLERTDVFSISAWVKPDNVTGLAYAVVDKSAAAAPNRGWSVILFRRSTLTASAVSLFLINTSNSNMIEVNSPASSIVPGAWQHIAASYEGNSSASGVQLYINGERQTKTVITDNLTSTIANSSVSPIIGGRENGLAQRFPGQLDDIRIYNRVLTQSEIRLLASRRGIGLTPLQDRGVSLPRKLSVNVGGTWRAADAYVNVAGVWRLGQASVNVAGTWR